MKALLTPAFRRWAYGVGTAAAAFLGIKGLLSDQDVSALNLLLSAVFGMAFFHVPDAEEGE